LAGIGSFGEKDSYGRAVGNFGTRKADLNSSNLFSLVLKYLNFRLFNLRESG
jgi:hypothetical protein